MQRQLHLVALTLTLGITAGAALAGGSHDEVAIGEPGSKPTRP